MEPGKIARARHRHRRAPDLVGQHPAGLHEGHRHGERQRNRIARRPHQVRRLPLVVPPVELVRVREVQGLVADMQAQRRLLLRRELLCGPRRPPVLVGPDEAEDQRAGRHHHEVRQIAVLLVEHHEVADLVGVRTELDAGIDLRQASDVFGPPVSDRLGERAHRLGAHGERARPDLPAPAHAHRADARGLHVGVRRVGVARDRRRVHPRAVGHFHLDLVAQVVGDQRVGLLGLAGDVGVGVGRAHPLVGERARGAGDRGQGLAHASDT